MSFKKKKYVFAVIMIFSVIFMFGMTARHEKLHAEGIGVVSVKGILTSGQVPEHIILNSNTVALELFYLTGRELRSWEKTAAGTI